MRKRDPSSPVRFPFPMAIGPALAALGVCVGVYAQGPGVSYYYHPRTELSWATCFLHLEGGSRQKIPFLPVICSSFRHAPLGTGAYDKDAAADGPVIFAGNGISKAGTWDSYTGRRADYTTGPIDVAGGIVLIGWDGTDSIEANCGREFPLSRRIAEAAARKASAVVVFSGKKEFPFPDVRYDREDEIPDIPVISVTRGSILDILASAGVDGEETLRTWAATGTPPESRVLICRLAIEIRGRFDKVETEHFLFRFRSAFIPEAQMGQLARVNEKSLEFLRKLFEDEQGLRWRKLPVHYFRDYDAKTFFTRHWGLGWATDEGTYLVHPGGLPNLPLVVHENAHILIGQNWGGSSSFLSEGIGMYAEAEAEDRGRNDRRTIGYLREGKLFRLKDMLAFNIGMPGLETDVGYPAAGSFVGFLVRTRGLKGFKEIYLAVAPTVDGGTSDDIWRQAAGKPLAGIEREWLEDLARSHPGDAAAIRRYITDTIK